MMAANSEIVDEDVLFGLFIETVGDSGSGWFVDDSEDIETSDGTGVFGGLTLSVREVGRDSDDSVGNGFTC